MPDTLVVNASPLIFLGACGLLGPEVPGQDGESSVVAWALAHRDAAVVMDDLAGRRCARSFGVVVRGTLGLVLRGHRRGVVPDPRAAIDGMRARGMWLGDAVVERALRQAGVKLA